MSSNLLSPIRVGLSVLALAMTIPGAAMAQAPAGASPQGQSPPGTPAGAGFAAAAAAMKNPFPPFHMIGSIYYVGSTGLSCYLIHTPRGNILLDTGYPDMAPQIEGNIEKLGFKLKDTKLLINSHAHIDHGGGMAAIKSSSWPRTRLSLKAAATMTCCSATEISFPP
jgi:metallo-beta-lactamase class B